MKSKRNILITLIFLSYFDIILSQFVVNGKVTDTQNSPIEYATIILVETMEGVISDLSGNFKINSLKLDMNIHDTITLQCSCIGYIEKQVKLYIRKDKTLNVNFKLKENITELKAVTITSGSYEAGDKKRNTTLTKLDIITTGASNNDITSAIMMLPGVQNVSEEEGLFVRGSENTESSYYIDGLLVESPYYKGSPNVAQRGRFSPSLFRGYSFLNGGYSALYGGGLSSVLSLETVDMPTNSSANLNIGSVMASSGIQINNKTKNRSLGVDLNYVNLKPYYSIVDQRYNYTLPPLFTTYLLNYINKYKKGVLKILYSANYNKVQLIKENIDSIGLFDDFYNYGNGSFTFITNEFNINEKTRMYSGFGYSYTDDHAINLLKDINYHQPTFDSTNYFFDQSYKKSIKSSLFQARSQIEYSYKNLGKLIFGFHYFSNLKEFKSVNGSIDISDDYSTLFLENNFNISNNIAFRFGIRSEYSKQIDKYNLAYRTAIAYRLASGLDINIIHGTYYQRPDLFQVQTKYVKKIAFQKAIHNIIGIQYFNNKRILRLESFYYNYANLPLYLTPDSINFRGKGNSMGIDLFYRDRKTFNNFDYWIGYSYLYAKRKYKEFPSFMRPNYTSPHTFNFVIKRFIPKMNLQVNSTYTFSPGRYYYHIKYIDNAYQILDKGTLSSINSIGLSLNYLFNLKDKYGIAVFTCSNVLGIDKPLNYQYSNRIDSNGEYFKQPIMRQAPRFYYLGIILNMGIDRRQSEIDKLLQ